MTHLFKGMFAALLLTNGMQTHAGLITFDDLSAGDSVTTIGNVNFSFSDGIDLVVSNLFLTSSGGNYLGTADPSNLNVFFPLERLTLDFAEAITEITVNFISSPSVPLRLLPAPH